MNFHHNHRLLFGAAIGLFLILTIAVAIFPALQNQANYKPLPNTEPMSADAIAGKKSYIANGCVACHSQQVRNVAMDNVWGTRPSIASDYAHIGRTDFWRNTATLMGTERTGPDLIAIGTRQPSEAWHLLHLYNPRAVVPHSIMPAYPWMFENKENPGPDDVVVNVAEKYNRGTGKVVAKKEALQMVQYLLSLKQTPLPDGTPAMEFLKKSEEGTVKGPTDTGLAAGPSGGSLYANNCQACHQADGGGLAGTFPPLKDSKIVLDDSPEKMILIMLKGYNSRKAQGYPPMPPIAVTNGLDATEIHAIVNHARTSWGNDAPTVPLEKVEEIINKAAP